MRTSHLSHFFFFSELEEEGGFGIYGEKTRYASLQRKRDPNMTSTSQRGYETMRNIRTSIPSLVRLNNKSIYKSLLVLINGSFQFRE